MLHTFKNVGRSGIAFTTMGWVKCFNTGGSWASIWHLGVNNNDRERNPAMWLNMAGRYLHSC